MWAVHFFRKSYFTNSFYKLYIPNYTYFYVNINNLTFQLDGHIIANLKNSKHLNSIKLQSTSKHWTQHILNHTTKKNPHSVSFTLKKSIQFHSSKIAFDLKDLSPTYQILRKKKKSSSLHTHNQLIESTLNQL